MEKTAMGKRPVRLLGIPVSNLSADPESQLSPFLEDKGPLKKNKLSTALDSIQEKFRGKGIRPGTLLTK
jgi:hypothetical protein